VSDDKLFDLNRLQADIKQLDDAITNRKRLLDDLIQSKNPADVLKNALDEGFYLIPDQEIWIEAYKAIAGVNSVLENIHKILSDSGSLKDDFKTRLNAQNQALLNTDKEYLEQTAKTLEKIVPYITRYIKLYEEIENTAGSDEDLKKFVDRRIALKTEIKAAVADQDFVKFVLDTYGQLCEHRLLQLKKWRRLMVYITKQIDAFQEKVTLEINNATVLLKNQHDSREELAKYADSLATALYGELSPETLYHLGGAIEYSINTIPEKNTGIIADFKTLATKLKYQYEQLSKLRSVHNEIEKRINEIFTGEIQKTIVGVSQAAANELAQHIKRQDKQYSRTRILAPIALVVAIIALILAVVSLINNRVGGAVGAVSLTPTLMGTDKSAETSPFIDGSGAASGLSERTSTNTPTGTPSRTFTPTGTLTFTATNTETRTPTPTLTQIATPTHTFTATLTYTLIQTHTPTHTETPIPTATLTPSNTPVSVEAGTLVAMTTATIEPIIITVDSGVNIRNSPSNENPTNVVDTTLTTQPLIVIGQAYDTQNQIWYQIRDAAGASLYVASFANGVHVPTKLER